MENVSDKDLLEKIVALLEKKNVEAPLKSRRDNLPLIIALIGLFGTIFGYFWNSNAQINQLEKQSEYDLMKQAFESAETGWERQSNLLLLANMDLIPEHKDSVMKGLKNSIIDTSGQLIFLDNPTYEGYDYYSLGFELVDKARYKTAIKALEKAIELDSLYYHSYTQLGYCYRQQYRYDRAIEEYTKAINLTFWNKSLAYYNRAICYEKIGDESMACADFQVALKEEAKFDSDDTLLIQASIENAEIQIKAYCK